MRQLDLLAKTCAVLGGALLTVITLMTCVSVIGRNTVGWTIVGDFELTGAVAGAGIALFLPYCQLKPGPAPTRAPRLTGWGRCCSRWP